MAVIVDDQSGTVIDGILRSKRCVATIAVGAGMIVLGALVGDRDAHGVTIMAIGGAFVLAALLVPYCVYLAVQLLRRPARSGPPIDPSGEMAAVEAVVLNRIGQTDEHVELRLAQTDEAVEQLRSDVRGFVCMLGGVSEAVAQRAERFRKTS